MNTQSEPAAVEASARRETVTPLIERSINEILRLAAQLFTTPIAFLTYNKRFRDQISALVKDDLEAAYPETVARPLTFFVLMAGAHFLMSRIYWKMVFPGKSLSKAFAASAGELAPRNDSGLVAGLSQRFKDIYALLESVAGGKTQALLMIASAVTLIIAAKACFVSVAGRTFGCPVRVRSALHASAYGFGTFIFFQYVFILLRYLAAVISDGPGFQYGYGIVVYGSVIVSVVLVIRVNQAIRQSDGTAELPTYAAWLLGTVVWQFGIIFAASYIVGNGAGDFGEVFRLCWGALLRAFGPQSLLHP